MYRKIYSHANSIRVLMMMMMMKKIDDIESDPLVMPSVQHTSTRYFHY